MKKINYLKLVVILCLFFAFSKHGLAQVNGSATNNQKTVIYKIHAGAKNQSLSQATCDNIDKMFTGKTGIVSSKTNGITYQTSVKMLSSVPEKDLKAIFISQGLEVESINVTDNKN